MTVFAKREMSVHEWGKVQDQIGKLQMALGGPHDLMMLSSPSGKPGIEVIYIGLPTEAFLSTFPRFQRIAQSELPNGLSAIICREDRFEELFPDIFQKTPSKYFV